MEELQERRDGVVVTRRDGDVGPGRRLAEERARATARITVTGALVNALLTILKAVAGLLGGSAALVADALHSLSDLLSDGVVLVAGRLSGRPADERHPYGYGRFETVGTVILVLILMGGAVGIGVDAWSRLDDLQVPSSMTLWLAGLAIAAKEALYHATVRVGRRYGSRLLMANAWHHRTDALSSVAALAGIVGARAGYPVLDPIAAMVVAGAIALSAIRFAQQAMHELTERAIERGMLEELQAGIAALPGVVSLHNLRARRMGPQILVDLHVEVDGTTTVSDGHQVAERVRQFVQERQPSISEVLVHVDAEPDDDGGQPGTPVLRPRQEVEAAVRAVAATLPEVRRVTHVLVHYLSQRVAAQVHIEVDADKRVREAAAVARRLRDRLESETVVDHVDIHLELDDRAHGEFPAAFGDNAAESSHWSEGIER